MKTLESGRVYDISLPGYSGDTPIESVFNDFINKHNNITGLDTTVEWSVGGEGDEWYGFYLPPIISNDYYKFSLYANRQNPQTIEYTDIDLIGFSKQGSNYVNDNIIKSDIPYACAYKIKGQNEYSYAFGSDIQFTSDFYFRYDTRFLNSHHFYTINCFGCNKGTELDELYYAPLIFVYNDGTTNSDDILIFNQIGSHNSYWKDPQFVTEFNNVDNIYIPQLYTNQDKSIILQKSNMGGGCGSNKIYITNASKFNKLENLVNYKKMVEYKDCWLKGKLYIEDNGLYCGKKFIMGVSSLKKFDYANPYDEEEKITTPYIPVIQGDDIPNTSIKPPNPQDPGIAALKFSSDDDFYLMVDNPRWDGIIEYSLDNGKSWHIWGGEYLSGNLNRSIYLRGSNNGTISRSYNGRFQTTCKYCYGNIETLRDYKLVEKNIRLGVMQLNCYANMFRDCTSLIKAPKLPATELANSCYSNMFSGCTSLIEIPELPATTLANSCYGNMFEDCTSLTKAPELPATTLTSYCYYGMFSGCSSLVEAPELPATTLANNCYENMFYSCRSLAQAPELPATTLANRCYANMFSTCYSLTKAPKLPATTLADECYRSMFFGCTSLIKAPNLLAKVLDHRCYENMFSYCTSLVESPKISATAIYNKSATDGGESCCEGMFLNCTSLIVLPYLYIDFFGGGVSRDPINYNCYKEMFKNTKNALSLEKTEQYKYEYKIPANTIADPLPHESVLQNMFLYTAGSFTGTPFANTTYYTDHKPV